MRSFRFSFVIVEEAHTAYTIIIEVVTQKDSYDISHNRYNKCLLLHTCIVRLPTPIQSTAICAKNIGTCLRASTMCVLHMFYWERDGDQERNRRWNGLRKMGGGKRRFE